jgi:hypothetical protein
VGSTTPSACPLTDSARTASPDEIHTTSGDVRRASDRLGMTIPPLLRYLATLNHPNLDSVRGSP